MAHTDRIVVLVDMDCFYCQVEEKLDSKLEGKPIAVVQYNAWRGGGIIAVNYVAREKGVTRHMRGDEAKEMCPEIELVRVPQVRGKADLTKYREAGKKVAEVLQTFTPLLERASVDEAYLDITEQVENRIGTLNKLDPDTMKNTFVVGRGTEDFLSDVWQNRKYCENDFKLAVGGLLVEEIRARVFQVTGYKCSAGIAHNKILAKLACGIHKPNKQTILPQDAIPELYQTLPIKKIKSLGGKFGNLVSEKLNISTMGELSNYSEKELVAHFDEKSANWLYKIARGIDNEPVTTKLISKSIGCCKKFPGKNALLNEEAVHHWMSELALEIAERLQKDVEENHRRARNIVVSYSQDINGKEVSSTRTVALNAYDQNKICSTGMEVIKKNCLKADRSCCIKFLGLSVGHFEDIKKVREITSFFIKNSADKNISNLIDKNSQPDSNSSTKVKEDINQESEKSNKNETNQHKSVFDTDTDEEDIDKSCLVYYNEDNVSRQSSIANSSKDSISYEINLETNASSSSVETKSMDSFFARYFERISTHTPIDRNFDTSSALNENEVNETELAEEHLENTNDENISQYNENTTIMNTDLDNICSFCNKLVAITDMQSHMDYHYAIQLVKNEAHLYKKQQQPLHSKDVTNDNAKIKTKSNNKKKASNLKPISNFLHKETENVSTENSEFCTECSKRIRVDEFPDHLDYHTAKKLHLELNSKTSPTRKILPKNKIKGGKKPKSLQSRNIATYFNEKL